MKEVKAVIFVCDGDPVQCPELAYEHGKHHSLFPSFFFFSRWHSISYSIHSLPQVPVFARLSPVKIFGSCCIFRMTLARSEGPLIKFNVGYLWLGLVFLSLNTSIN